MKKILNQLAVLIVITLSLVLTSQTISDQAKNFPQVLGTKNSQEVKYKVIKVVDGDTVDLDTIGKVRLIGVDTPELVDPRKPVQCFAKQASDYLKSLLNDKEVTIEYDKSQGTKDKYGRTLLYIFLDNKNVNEIIIAQGYGFEYTYRTPYKYQKEFKQAQSDAKTYKLGLWGDICNYN